MEELIRSKAIANLVAVTDALARLNDDPDRFTLLLADRQEKGIGNLPIADFLKPQEFVERVSCGSGQAKHQLRFAVRRRYRESPQIDPLVADIPWLRQVERGLKDSLKRSKPRTPSRLLLKHLVDEIQQARAHLQAAQRRVSHSKQPVEQPDGAAARPKPIAAKTRSAVSRPDNSGSQPQEQKSRL